MNNNPFHRSLASLLSALCCIVLAINSCARMGQPDGGWYDDMPPRVVSSSPADGAVGVRGKRVIINFDEFIRLDNPNEKVIVSPPQITPAEIKVQGRRIIVDLKDSLQENTTYTIDFSDAITDNTEGNAMGNFTYSFSTGGEIDTLEVSGYVLNAADLEPIKGMIVGLYDADADFFTSRPMRRISRTDAAGRFSIKGVAAGSYVIYALGDTDGDYHLSVRGEQLAFHDDVIVPSSKPDIRQDTIWRDSLHIGAIMRTGYTHFLPDDVTLRVFSEKPSEQYLIQSNRREPERLTMVFSRGCDELPELTPLNFSASDPFVIETSSERDTLLYWLRSSELVSQDTLLVAARYQTTDTLGQIVTVTDTIEFISRQSVAKRQRDYERRREQWQWQQEKAARSGHKQEYIMTEDTYRLTYLMQNDMSPIDVIGIKMPSPPASVDTTRIRLLAKQDSTFILQPFRLLTPDAPSIASNPSIRQQTIADRRALFVQADWETDREYRIEVDSAAFIDLAERPSMKFAKTFRVRSENDFGRLEVVLTGQTADSTVVVELLNESGKTVRRAVAHKRKVAFDYLSPSRYYLRCFIDSNRNGQHDNGNFDKRQQPEAMFYNPKAIDIRERWDTKEQWNPTAVPLYRQKPNEIKQQKADSRRMLQNKNEERARRLGIPYQPK